MSAAICASARVVLASFGLKALSHALASDGDETDEVVEVSDDVDEMVAMDEMDCDRVEPAAFDFDGVA